MLSITLQEFSTTTKALECHSENMVVKVHTATGGRGESYLSHKDYPYPPSAFSNALSISKTKHIHGDHEARQQIRPVQAGASSNLHTHPWCPI